MSPTADAEVSRPYLPLNNNPNSLWVVPALLLQLDYKPISAYIYELAHIPGADQRVSVKEMKDRTTARQEMADPISVMFSLTALMPPTCDPGNPD